MADVWINKTDRGAFLPRWSVTINAADCCHDESLTPFQVHLKEVHILTFNELLVSMHISSILAIYKVSKSLEFILQ